MPSDRRRVHSVGAVALAGLLIMTACTSEPERSSAADEPSARPLPPAEASTETLRDTAQEDALRRKSERLEAERDRLASELEEMRRRADDLGYRHEADAYGWEHAAVRGCSSSVSGVVSRSPADVTIGPVTFLKLSEAADQPSSQFESNGQFPANKFVTLVEPGSSVLLVVPDQARQELGLLYDREVWQRDSMYRIEEAGRAVVLAACSPQQRQEPTQFNGGFVVAGARCTVLDVYVKGEDAPKRLDISFGKGDC